MKLQPFITSEPDSFDVRQPFVQILAHNYLPKISECISLYEDLKMFIASVIFSSKLTKRLKIGERPLYKYKDRSKTIFLKYAWFWKEQLFSAFIDRSLQAYGCPCYFWDSDNHTAWKFIYQQIILFVFFPTAWTQKRYPNLLTNYNFSPQ